MNDYSADWVNLFLRDFDAAQTRREVDFLIGQLPRDRFPRVLDVCCGLGRHSRALADAGYAVTAIDRGANLIAEVAARDSRVRFICQSAENISSLGGPFDGVICLWQSFGFLDRAGNDRILQDIAGLLTSGGRFVLDIYHRGFFEKNLGERTREHAGRSVREVKSLTGDRLKVVLHYDGNETPSDAFDWQIFTPEQIIEQAARLGFQPLVICTDFNADSPATPAAPRMQIVLQRS